MINFMGRESFNPIKEPTLESSRIICLKGKVSLFTWMEIDLRDHGVKGKSMDMVHLDIKWVTGMKVSISRMRDKG